MTSGITPIGGPDTANFALTPEPLARLDGRVTEGKLAVPVSIVRHDRSGGFVRFASADVALVAKMAIV